MAAAVAPAPGHTFERLNLARSHTLPYKDTKRAQDGKNKVRFLPDKLDTGARVLSEYYPDDSRLQVPCTNMLTSYLR